MCACRSYVKQTNKQQFTFIHSASSASLWTITRLSLVLLRTEHRAKESAREKERERRRVCVKRRVDNENIKYINKFMYFLRIFCNCNWNSAQVVCCVIVVVVVVCASLIVGHAHRCRLGRINATHTKIWQKSTQNGDKFKRQRNAPAQCLRQKKQQQKQRNEKKNKTKLDEIYATKLCRRQRSSNNSSSSRGSERERRPIADRLRR